MWSQERSTGFESYTHLESPFLGFLRLREGITVTVNLFRKGAMTASCSCVLQVASLHEVCKSFKLSAVHFLA